MKENKTKDLITEILNKAKEKLDHKLFNPTLTRPNKDALENCLGEFEELLCKEEYIKYLSVKASTFENKVKTAINHFIGHMNKALNASNNEVAEKLLRYLKDTLKSRADNKKDFKYYDVDQKELIDKNTRIYGDIDWKEDYKIKGVFQSEWACYIKEIKEYEPLQSQAVSENKQPYSSKELIKGVKRLLSICDKYLSPRHILKGMGQWLNIAEQTARIDHGEYREDAEKNFSADENEKVIIEIDVERNFSKFIKILLDLSAKERNCYFQVLFEEYEDTTYPFDEAMKKLKLNSSQDVKNNYLKAMDKIKNALSDQSIRLVFSKFMKKYFDCEDFRTLVENELDGRRTK